MQERVKPPAICLAIVGGLGVLLAAYTLVGHVFGFGTSQPETLRQLGMPEKLVELSASSGFMVIIAHLLQLTVMLFVTVGALRIMKLRSWGWGFAASIIAMLPCISPCCPLGIPAGIWCLYVLMKPDVKEAFGG